MQVKGKRIKVVEIRLHSINHIFLNAMFSYIAGRIRRLLESVSKEGQHYSKVSTQGVVYDD